MNLAFNTFQRVALLMLSSKGPVTSVQWQYMARSTICSIAMQFQCICSRLVTGRTLSGATGKQKLFVLLTEPWSFSPRPFPSTSAPSSFCRHGQAGPCPNKYLHGTDAIELSVKMEEARSSSNLLVIYLYYTHTHYIYIYHT